MTIKEFLNNYNYNINEEINLKIIGITGSVGKSSIAYIIYKYLKEQHKNVVINSSVCSDYDDMNLIVSENELVILNKNDLANIIYKSYLAGAEYLILECHFISLEANIFEDIPFAVRTITYTNDGPSAEMEDEEYYTCKRNLIQNAHGGSVLLNISDPAFYFYKDSFVADDIFYLDYASPNFPWPRNGESFNSYKEFYNARRAQLGFPEPQYVMDYCLQGVKSSFAKLSVNGKNFDAWIRLPLYFGIINTLHAAAILDILGEFDVDKMLEFLEDFNCIPGRGEVFELEDNKIIILDLGSFTYVKALKEWKETIPTFDGILDSDLKDQVDRFGGVNFQRLEAVAPLVTTNPEAIKIMKNLFPNTKMRLEATTGPTSTSPSRFNNYADFAYLTPLSPGSIDMVKFFDVYKQKIIIPNTFIEDRALAINTAIKNMQPNTILVVAGRGRRLIYRSGDGVKMLSDYQEIVKTINQLEMEDDNNEII